MELSFPPRFGVAWIYSTGVTREFVGYVLAKRRVELGRFVARIAAHDRYIFSPTNVNFILVSLIII